MIRRMFAPASIAFGLSILNATGAMATAQRTFVASTGNDANPCSIIQPCRGFARAIAQTTATGEVIVLDSAGYGSVTIGKSVAIIAPKGVYAGISVFGGVGVVVTGNPTASVLLRGLTLNAQGGTIGISFDQGSEIAVEDCENSGFSIYGILVSATNSTVSIGSTVLRNNHSAIVAQPDANTRTFIDEIYVSGYQGEGISVGPGTATVSNSVIANGGPNAIGVLSSTISANSDVMVTRSVITGSQYGVETFSDFGNSTRMVVDGSAINLVTSAAFSFNNGGGTEIIYSPGNNTIGFNNGIVTGGVLTTPCCLH